MDFHIPNWTLQFPISLAVEGEACYERMSLVGIEPER